MKNMDKLFIEFSGDVELKEGDVVSTTTSTFPYDNYYGSFVNEEELTAYADVEVEHVRSDYSEYDPRTCRDGGDYGYDYYIVTEIREVGEL